MFHIYDLIISAVNFFHRLTINSFHGFVYQQISITLIFIIYQRIYIYKEY